MCKLMYVYLLRGDLHFFVWMLRQVGFISFLFSTLKDKVVLYLNILRASFVLTFAWMEANTKMIVVICSDFLCLFCASCLGWISLMYKIMRCRCHCWHELLHKRQRYICLCVHSGSNIIYAEQPHWRGTQTPASHVYLCGVMATTPLRVQI